MSAGTQTAGPRRGAFRAARPRAGFAAALLHRLSGIALALFLPMHFIALGTALQGADRLESFLGLTHNGLVRTAEWGLVSALALHMVLGLRVLALEWFVARERTALVVCACVAAGLAVGLLFLLGGA
ncbi:MAG: succinate dehydrogenase [Microvirga sp.]